jgi:hypothetical protein
MSMKNSNDTIENRTRDLPVCSTVSQPTAPPRAPRSQTKHLFMRGKIKCVRFTTSPSTAALSHWQPASTDKYGASCRTPGRDKRDTMMQLAPEMQKRPSGRRLWNSCCSRPNITSVRPSEQAGSSQCAVHLCPMALVNRLEKAPVSVHGLCKRVTVIVSKMLTERDGSAVYVT